MPVGASTRPVIGFFDERFFLVAEARRRFAAVGELRAISDLGDAVDCEVLCAFHDAPIERDVIEAAAKCEMIIHNGSAILCDVDAATENGVLVVHFPGYNSRSVAEHAVGLLLDVWKGLTRSDRAVRSGDPWQVAGPGLLTAEIFDKTLGLVGFGHVAQHVGRIARDGLGMRVQVWSRRREPVADAGFDWTPDLDRLLAASDAVSIHLALNDGTRGLLDAGRIECLKAGALVINTARAALVDCDALHWALVDGRVGGAGFDVWPGNRPDPGFVLLRSPNTVLTQHNAGYTEEAALRSMDAALAAVQAVLRGEHPQTGRIVNPSVLAAKKGPLP